MGCESMADFKGFQVFCCLLHPWDTVRILLTFWSLQALAHPNAEINLMLRPEQLFHLLFHTPFDRTSVLAQESRA